MHIPTEHQNASPRPGERGIYIDFEGRMDEPPCLIGVLVEGEFEQLVLDPALALAAFAKGLCVCPIETAIERIVNRAEREKRCVFAFTRHEINVVEEYTPWGPRMGMIYKDGHKIAKRWFNTLHHGENIDDWTLRGFANYLGITYPTHFGTQNAAARILYVRDMLRRKGSWEALTPVAKRKWTVLLSYNRWDCETLRSVVIRATSELHQA